MGDFIEPIVEIAVGAVEAISDSSDSPKGCLIGLVTIGVVVGIIALIIYLI
jgi:hypothetical protein